MNTALKKKKSSKGKIFIVLLVLIVALGLGVKNYIYMSLEPVHTKENAIEVSVFIPSGSNTDTITDILHNSNLIKNEIIFKLAAKLKGMDGRLKAGNYILNTSMSSEEILNELVEGGVLKETTKFTIPEGFELRQIADRLSEQGLINRDKFMEITSDIDNFRGEYEFIDELSSGITMEGYLFPDTYEIFIDATEEEIVNKMLSRFENVYKEKLKDQTFKMGLDLNQFITLASIIEREAMADDERPVVAGVFYNRLDINMPLQSCATVQFVLGERKPILSTKDTEITSPFNTYINNGLPPSPIASPGLESIEAALNPKETEYLYFVAKPDGTHVFNTDYDDHIRAKNRIRKQ